MSNVLTTVTLLNEFLGMVKIDLKSAWPGRPSISPMSYNTYKNMCIWLNESGVRHRFHWDNTGQYLPDAVYLDTKSDSATYFMLKYGISCK